MPELQALIFDVDGTLADTERDGHRVAFNRAFVDRGLDWHWSVEQYGELLEVAGGKERIQFYIEQYHPAGVPSTDLQAWIVDLHRAKTQHYKQLLQKNIIPLRPGVKRLIQEARQQGVRLAIATTTSPENVTALLEKSLAPGSSAWFEVIAAGDIVPEKKPAPDIYVYVLQAMNLPTANGLVIEDSHQGLQAAMQAGLPTVITLNDYTRSHDFSGARLVVDQLGEPDQPFQTIAGSIDPATTDSASYFDMTLARRLLH